MKISSLSKRLKALSDPTRLKIIYLLSHRPACVCELASILSLSQPTLTRHLQKLEQAGFIKATRYKFYQIYNLDFEDEMSKALAEIVLAHLENLPELAPLKEIFKEKIPFTPLETSYGITPRD